MAFVDQMHDDTQPNQRGREARDEDDVECARSHRQQAKCHERSEKGATGVQEAVNAEGRPPGDRAVR